MNVQPTIMILSGAGIAAAAVWGIASLVNRPLSLGTIGCRSPRSSSNEQKSDNEPEPANMIPLVPEKRHEELASIGHEYKNIFQVILGYTYLTLEQLDSSAPQRSNLEQVQHFAQQGGKLADRLHDLSREVVSDTRQPNSGDRCS